MTEMTTNMMVFYMLLALLALWLLMHLFFELHYFTRTLISVVFAKICRKKVFIMDETVVKGVCLTTDIDSLLTHMNNARFLRELDFAKIDFYERTALYSTIKRHKGSLALGATTIRYRRFIKLFTRYSITSKIIHWDDKHIYMEHKFISRSDKFVNAIAMCKIRLIRCNADTIMQELLTAGHVDVENFSKEKPEPPLELTTWIESNDISSAKLRTAATLI